MAEKVELLVRIQLTREEGQPDRTAEQVHADAEAELESAFGRQSVEVYGPKGCALYTVKDITVVSHSTTHTKPSG